MAKDDAILIAGTIVEHQTSTGTWKRIPRVTALGAIGEQSSPKEKTTLEDTIKKYSSGLRDAPDKNMKGQYIPVQVNGDKYYDDYMLQQEFITRCQNEEEFNIRVTWPDGEINGFLFKALGFQFDEGTQEDWKMWSVNAKANSRTVFAAKLTGSATVAVAGTLTPALTTTPVLTAAEMGEVKWTSSNTAKATVSNSGVVTGVQAGSTVITAEVRGVKATLSVTVS